MFLSLFVALGLIAVISLSPVDTGDARQWSLSRTAQALDYTQILDDRAEDETVVVQWVTPEVWEQLDAAAERMLRDYAVVSVVHYKVSSLGEIESYVPNGVRILESDGVTARTALDEANLPPALQGFLVAYSGMAKRGYGNIGSGFAIFVFDSVGIHSCKPGAFWVEYAGVKYDYRTPIPGCPSPGPADRTDRASPTLG
jgi:hypothetical protein